jgi:hypothetical protein
MGLGTEDGHRHRPETAELDTPRLLGGQPGQLFSTC